MRQRRIDRGALTLASPEVKFEIDTETHDPLDVGKSIRMLDILFIYNYPVPNTDSLFVDIGMYQVREANQMVEEFMLAANMSVAGKILKEFPSCSLLRYVNGF